MVSGSRRTARAKMNWMPSCRFARNGRRSISPWSIWSPPTSRTCSVDWAATTCWRSSDAAAWASCLKGFDRELNRCVAIKVLAPHLAHSSLAKQRFAREAQAAAAVVHPHVLAIHQVQPNGRLPFLVMPLVAGESLAARLAAQGTLELKEILRIGMQAAAGLAAAHEQGLVHRDVKPANILLEKGVERAVLTDFGLARAADDVTLTRWGIIAGTPQYMSPEQARGEPLDGRSDLFSLGCVLYEMATGVSPFRADSMMATLRRLVDDSPQAMASLNPELPPWFIAIVDRLLEKDPSRRFDSAKEVSAIAGRLPGARPATGCRASASFRCASIQRQPFLCHLTPFVRSYRHDRRFRFQSVRNHLLASHDTAGHRRQMAGRGMGAVVLDAKQPGQYEGSYTDSDNARSGTVHLKWSRVERRFNGTWREGDDRHGKISLRLVDDQIRGAWTTDETPYIKPGTPGLADLLWVRETDSPRALDAGPATVASSRKPLTSVDEVEAHIRKLIEDRKSLQNIYADFTARHAGGNTDAWSHYQIWLHGDKERADRKGVVGDAGHTEIFTADFSLRVDRRSGHSQYASRLTRGSVCGIPDLRRFGIVPWWVDTIRNHDPELTLLPPRRKNMTVEIGHHQGQPISIVKFDVTNDQGHDSWHEYWLSPTQGNLPIRISGGDKAKTSVISQTNCWEQFDGVWFPRRMDFKCQNAGQPDKESVVEVKQARFNMSPFPDVFTPDGSILQKD